MKNAVFEAKIGVDTSKFHRNLEFGASAFGISPVASVATEDRFLARVSKHPLHGSAVAAVGTAFAVGSSELICNALAFAQSLASFEK